MFTAKRRTGGAQITFHRRTDCRDPAGVFGRGEGFGAVPQTRHIGRDALQVEGQVWRHDGFRASAFYGRGLVAKGSEKGEWKLSGGQRRYRAFYLNCVHARFPRSRERLLGQCYPVPSDDALGKVPNYIRRGRAVWIPSFQRLDERLTFIFDAKPRDRMVLDAVSRTEVSLIRS